MTKQNLFRLGSGMLFALAALAVPAAADPQLGCQLPGGSTDSLALAAAPLFAPVHLTCVSQGELAAPLQPLDRPVEECYPICLPVHDECRAACAASGGSPFFCFRQCIGVFWGCVVDCMNS